MKDMLFLQGRYESKIEFMFVSGDPKRLIRTIVRRMVGSSRIPHFNLRVELSEKKASTDNHWPLAHSTATS